MDIGKAASQLIARLKQTQLGSLDSVADVINALRTAAEVPEGHVMLLEAAFGLCCGYDWNNGNHAVMHKYRRKLLEAVNALRPVPDYDGKIADALARESALATKDNRG